MKTMSLKIVTPSGTFLDRGGVTYLEVKGSEGVLGIMPGHSPFITTLVPAAIIFKTEYHRYDVAMSEGILFVRDDGVTILADAAYFKNQIDYIKAKKLLANALKRLKENREKDDVRRLRAQIATEEAKISLETLPGRIRLEQE